MSLEHGAVFERLLATLALLPVQIEIDPGAFDRDACRVAADFAGGDRPGTVVRAHEAHDLEEISGRASRNERVSRGLLCLRYTEVAPILARSLTYLKALMILHSGYGMERSTNRGEKKHGKSATVTVPAWLGAGLAQAWRRQSHIKPGLQ
jgi:hypothetical protein